MKDSDTKRDNSNFVAFFFFLHPECLQVRGRCFYSHLLVDTRYGVFPLIIPVLLGHSSALKEISSSASPRSSFFRANLGFLLPQAEHKEGIQMIQSFLPLKMLPPEWEVLLGKAKHCVNCLQPWLQMHALALS